MRFSRKMDNQKQQFYTFSGVKLLFFQFVYFLSDYNAFLLQIPAIAEWNILFCVGGGKWFWFWNGACPEKELSYNFFCCDSRCPHVPYRYAMLSF